MQFFSFIAAACIATILPFTSFIFSANHSNGPFNGITCGDHDIKR